MFIRIMKQLNCTFFKSWNLQRVMNTSENQHHSFMSQICDVFLSSSDLMHFLKMRCPEGFVVIGWLEAAPPHFSSKCLLSLSISLHLLLLIFLLFLLVPSEHLKIAAEGKVGQAPWRWWIHLCVFADLQAVSAAPPAF